MMNQRPAVILTALDEVDFITAARPIESRRPVLGFKHEICARLPIKTLRVAIAVRPDFRSRARLPDKWIVRRRGAVVVDAQGLAGE